MFLAIIAGMIGSSVAYLIIGGEFLYAIFSPAFGGTPLIYSLIFFIPGTLLVLKGIKTIAGIEIILSLALFAILFFLAFRSIPFINLENLSGFYPEFFFFPYGIMIFSFWGSNILLDIREMVGRKLLEKVIISGIAITAVFYLIFVTIIIGASGSGVSKDAISGLKEFLGPEVLILGFIFGIISCFTSYITLSLTFKKTLWYDFKVNKTLAWALSSFVPLLLFIFGIKRFITVINFTGAVSLGLEIFVLIVMYRAFLKKKYNKKINPFYYLLSAIFVAGAIFEIVNIFANI